MNRSHKASTPFQQVLIPFVVLLLSIFGASTQAVYAALVPHDIKAGELQSAPIKANGDFHVYRVDVKKANPPESVVKRVRNQDVTFTKGNDGYFYAPVSWSVSDVFNNNPDWGTAELEDMQNRDPDDPYLLQKFEINTTNPNIVVSNLGYQLSVRGMRFKPGAANANAAANNEEFTPEEWGATFTGLAIESFSPSTEIEEQEGDKQVKKTYLIIGRDGAVTIKGTTTAGKTVDNKGVEKDYKYTFEVAVQREGTNTWLPVKEFRKNAQGQVQPDERTGLVEHDTLTQWDLNATNADKSYKYPNGKYTVRLKVQAEQGGEDGEVTTVVQVARVDIDSDSDQDGIVNGSPEEEAVEEDSPGSIVLVNSDDDNADAKGDNEDAIINGADDVNDLGTLVLRRLPSLPEDYEVYLIANPERLRIFNSRAVGGTVLTPDSAAFPHLYKLNKAQLAAGDLTYGIEGIYGTGTDVRDFLVYLQIKKGNETVAIDQVKISLAPFIMLSNLQPAQKLYVSNADTNFNTAVKAVAGTAVADVDKDIYKEPAYYDAAGVLIYAPDVWVQDEVEIGYSRAPYGEMHVVFDLPRNRGLDYENPTHARWPEGELRAAGVGHIERGSDVTPSISGAESGGNLEVSPPVTVGGKEHKHGRIIVGSNMSTAQKNFLKAQKVQALDDELVELDVSWLAVGHADETMMIVKSNSPKGFAVLIADTNKAREVLRNVRVRHTGTVDTATATTFKDSNPSRLNPQAETDVVEPLPTNSWNVNEWTNGIVEITAGKGAGQVRRVLSNTNNTLTVAPAWEAGKTPDATSQYRLINRNAYLSMFAETEGVANAEDVGVATSVAGNTLTDTTKAWAAGRWDEDNAAGRRISAIRIVSGAGKGYTYPVITHTANSITVAGWVAGQTPDETSAYILVRKSKLDQWRAPAVRSVHDVLENEPLKPPHPAYDFFAFNDDAQIKLNTISAKLIDKLGLDAADLIRIPALFYNYDDGEAAAYIPDMVNLQVVGSNLLIAKPFGPRVNGNDVLEQDVNAKMTAIGNTSHFLNNWDLYHIAIGESHCGTNVKRTIPIAKWWE